MISVHNFPHRAHRISYEIHNNLIHDSIPAGLQICHHCDNRKCVNPSHLFIGTQFDNMRDCIKKKRYGAITHPERIIRGNKSTFKKHPEMFRGENHWSRKHPEKITIIGEHNGASKLTEKQVLEIRECYSLGESQRSLARRFPVCRTAIRMIIRGVNWKYLL